MAGVLKQPQKHLDFIIQPDAAGARPAARHTLMEETDALSDTDTRAHTLSQWHDSAPAHTAALCTLELTHRYPKHTQARLTPPLLFTDTHISNDGADSDFELSVLRLRTNFIGEIWPKC